MCKEGIHNTFYNYSLNKDYLQKRCHATVNTGQTTKVQNLINLSLVYMDWGYIPFQKLGFFHGGKNSNRKHLHGT